MKKELILAGLAGAALCNPMITHAGEQAPSGSADATIEQQPQSESGLFGNAAVSEETLRTTAGREDITQITQADLAAGVSQNSVGDNSVTGAAQISGNAFQNMSGLSILNVNTGNNVAINAAMNVNVSVTPGQ